MSAGSEAGFLKELLDWAWAVVGVLMGIIWKKHNEEISGIKTSISKVGEDMNANIKYFDQRIDSVERKSTPLVMFENNRKEMREGQIQIFARLDTLGQALARIEGKLDK